VKYERIDAGGKHGGLDAPEFLALNPNAVIPVIDDGGIVVWETNAILRYLAARYPRQMLWPRYPEDRAHADMWMDWSNSTFNPPLRDVVFHTMRLAPEDRDPAVRDKGMADLGDALRLLDRHLAKQDFVGGDYFTVGDIPAGAAYYAARALGAVPEGLGAAPAWFARLEGRPPFQKTVGAHMPASFDSK
jgi:glutathione S-transferase